MNDCTILTLLLLSLACYHTDIEGALGSLESVDMLTSAREVLFHECTPMVLEAKFGMINWNTDNLSTIRAVLKLESKEDIFDIPNTDKNDGLLHLVLKKLKDVQFQKRDDVRQGLSAYIAAGIVHPHFPPKKTVLFNKHFCFEKKQGLVAIYLQVPDLSKEDFGNIPFDHTKFQQQQEESPAGSMQVEQNTTNSFVFRSFN
mmetsp:Transcript_16867/g.31231  ORF Transcript_16867/g.31231 Transcript_16867/m.31231 type:complete len:201 (+) Transcript_16867:87-689(+)